MDQLPRLGKSELIFLLSFTCNIMVYVRRGFLFLLNLGIGCVILFWHSLGRPYNYFAGFLVFLCSLCEFSVSFGCVWPLQCLC